MIRGGASSGMKYSDCKSIEDKIAWLDSSSGQQVLQKRPRLLQLHRENKLRYMVAHPEYGPKLDIWLSDTSWISMGLSKLGQSFASLFDIGSGDRAGSSSVAGTAFPPKQFDTEVKLKLLTDGFAVLDGFLALPMCHTAIGCVNRVIGSLVTGGHQGHGQGHGLSSDPRQLKGGLIDTTSILSFEPELLALYNQSGLAESVSLLLHGEQKKNGSPSTATDAPYAYNCQIALRFPEATPTPSSSGGAPEEEHVWRTGAGWHIDGVDKLDFAPFSLLIGVVLSDQPDVNMGNLCVYPGSHHTLRPCVRKYATAVAAAVAAGRGAEQASQEFLMQNLPDALPVRVKMGDVVIVHQKLAHRGTSNFHYDIRKMIYFRISHRNHNQLKDGAIENIWLEFEGMSEVL